MLKDYRTAAGLTQEELAKKSGVSRVSINRYELGTRVPDVTVAIKLAQALNHSVEEVFSRMQKEAAR